MGVYADWVRKGAVYRGAASSKPRERKLSALQDLMLFACHLAKVNEKTLMSPERPVAAWEQQQQPVALAMRMNKGSLYECMFEQQLVGMFSWETQGQKRTALFREGIRRYA